METEANPKLTPQPPNGFWKSVLLVSAWINLSEIFRYFVFVMPMMKSRLTSVENVAPISIPIFVSWMIWDTILIAATVGFVWLYLDRFGLGIKNALHAASFIWAAIFGLLWLGLLNMNLASFPIVAIAWPLSWFELAIAAVLINHCRQAPKLGGNKPQNIPSNQTNAGVT